MDDEYDGDELCFQCNRDFPFIVIPSKGVEITCPYCGQVQHPCSLCDSDIVDCSKETCQYWIQKSLEYWSKEAV